MLDLAHGLAKEEQNKGNRPKPFRVMGYEGEHCGRIEYGQRDKASTILRLIGDAARANLDVAVSLADEVTRIDLAVTWRTNPPDPLLGRNAYALADMFHQAHPTSALPWFTGDSNGGYTCYVGKRRSENFLRIYNKGAEAIALDDDEGAKRYRACWRYELEAKGTVAPRLAHMVFDDEERERLIQDYVWRYAKSHGIEPAFPMAGKTAILPGFRRRSDAETKLRHLSKNVRPTVEWLKSEGQLDAARKALGLD